MSGLWKHGYRICHVTDLLSCCRSFSNASILIPVLNVNFRLFSVSAPESSLKTLTFYFLAGLQHEKPSEHTPKAQGKKKSTRKQTSKKQPEYRAFKKDLSFSKCKTSRVLSQYDFPGEGTFATKQCLVLNKQDNASILP